MTRYLNLDGDSGVVAFEIAADAIIVGFVSGCDYEYTKASAGADAIEAMKRLAEAGRGLATYINRHKPPYARKFRPGVRRF